MTTYTIAAVSAGLSQPSSTRLLADRLGAAATAALRGHGADDVRVVPVDVRDHAHALTDNVLTGFPNSALREVLETVTGADGLIAVTPVFNASYSGLFKTFFDVIEPGALEGVPVLLGATGGTARHSLAIDFALRPLMAYLRATVAPTGVYAASEDWGSEESGLAARIERAGGELAALVAGRAPAVAPDPYEQPTPFEQLLRSASGA
ncbi:FMN reductase [Actinomadura parmotrematis]|uniref:FMN reductase n=1 Tax=Actinomadura parmotrematis TaxID=2864039 RepID=A0ABS7G4M6_9ACTN|nr:FMN reductase [Actinomadura parmotrematis]MBW8487170.1 FMN reductase [Actinomadura parmotrematis]